MASTEPIRVERRCGQRFDYSAPVLLKLCGENLSGTGFTQDLSARGALVWTDLPLREGQVVDVALIMPALITLAEDMNVCCQARVVRVQHTPGSIRDAVALRIEKYDFPHQVRAIHSHPSAHLARP